MSTATKKRTTTDEMPNKPLEENLPPPRILWSGRSNDTLSRDCRVVLRYRWTLEAGSDNWEAVEDIVYEVVEHYDAMNEPVWGSHSRHDIPAQFFLDVCAAAQMPKCRMPEAGSLTHDVF